MKTTIRFVPATATDFGDFTPTPAFARLLKKAATESAPKAAKGPRVSKHAAIAAEVRAYRAIPSETDPTKPAHTHDQVGAKFGLKGSLVSAIVRNMVAHDPEYVPVFDGHRNLGPRVKPVAVEEVAPATDETPVDPDAASTEADGVLDVAEAGAVVAKAKRVRKPKTK